MKKFKEILRDQSHHHTIFAPSASVKLGQHTLSLKFDGKDHILEAAYTGDFDPWLSSLCEILQGLTLNDALDLNSKSWEERFKDDPVFWELKQEETERLINRPLVLLRGALDVYRGREYLYQEGSPLVCRCFGVRESDIIAHLNSEPNASFETLSKATKAGMGCRSCVSQIKPWFIRREKTKPDPFICRCFKVKESTIIEHINSEKNPSLETIALATRAGTKCRSCGDDLKKLLLPVAPSKSKRYINNRPVAEWLLEIDYMLTCFPLAEEWGMELRGLKNGRVLISFEKDVPQKEEEKVARELQDFLGAAFDLGLTFFLRRARHFSNAKG